METTIPSRKFWRQGEPFVWLTAAALGAIMGLTALLLAVVLYNAIPVFWPARVAMVELKDGSRFFGRRVRAQTDPNTDIRSVQFKTANRDLHPQRQDFRWINEDDIGQLSWPKEVYVLERKENGDFYGRLVELRTPGAEAGSGDARVGLEARFDAAMAEVDRQDADQLEPIAEELGVLSDRLHEVRYEIFELGYERAKRLEKQPRADVSRLAAQVAELAAEEKMIHESSDRMVARQQEILAAIRENVAVFADASGATREVALIDIVRHYRPNDMHLGKKIVHYGAKVWELLTAEPRESNTEGGLFPAIFGTVMLVFLMAIFCFPLGVLAGIYLGEYAREGPLVRTVRVAVNNLAGIPSIVYGIFGLGFFVYGVGGLIDRWLYPARLAMENRPTFGTGGILWASLTLGLLTVPVVIVATEEALRTIPRSIREGSYALGATKFQTLWRVLLPLGSPGIMTGFILAMARAAGEVAPLMITGVVKIAPDLPVDGNWPFFHLDRKFMHLGFHIYDVGFQSPNVEASKPMVYVTTLLLLLIVLTMTSVAIGLRNRMRRRFQSRTI